MIISLIRDVDDEMFNDLINAVNSLPDEEDLTIYLSTDGGSALVSMRICDLIEQNRDRIELIAAGEIYSAGFEIFFKSKCRRRIVSGTYGMYHTSRLTVQIDVHKRPTNEDNRQVLLWGKNYKTNDMLTFCSTLPLTKAELSNLKKGVDVYFTYERIQEFLDYQQQIELADATAEADQHLEEQRQLWLDGLNTQHTNV